MSIELMTQSYKRITKTQMVVLQTRKFPIFLCQTFIQIRYDYNHIIALTNTSP